MVYIHIITNTFIYIYIHLSTYNSCCINNNNIYYYYYIMYNNFRKITNYIPLDTSTRINTSDGLPEQTTSGPSDLGSPTRRWDTCRF